MIWVALRILFAWYFSFERSALVLCSVMISWKRPVHLPRQLRWTAQDVWKEENCLKTTLLAAALLWCSSKWNGGGARCSAHCVCAVWLLPPGTVKCSSLTFCLMTASYKEACGFLNYNAIRGVYYYMYVYMYTCLFTHIYDVAFT